MKQVITVGEKRMIIQLIDNIKYNIDFIEQLLQQLEEMKQ